jgi:hypothetical protein
VKTADEIHARLEGDFRAIFFVSALSGESVDALFQFAVAEGAAFAARIIAPQESALAAPVDARMGCC